MTTTATKPRLGRRPRRETPPCARCGTLKGFIAADSLSPERINGKPYGFDGTLCKNCYSSLRKAKRKAEGRLKPSKRQQEQARKIRRVLAKLARDATVTVTRHGLDHPDRQAIAEARQWLVAILPLPLIDPWFTYDHLTRRAKARLEIRAARREGRL
jgi:hypothetical protein